MNVSAAIADSLLRQAFGGQARLSRPRRTVSSTPRSLRTPRARHRRLTNSAASTNVALIILRAVDLAMRLRDFATNRHE
ncbi:MAG: hypothetical protein OJF51_002732 [Nitrospira sp.]|nr:MAG: hypothetical protein OJF51_002732 [Nitrospira sp.]